MDKLNRHLFGDNFQWGVSTAAFQIEGACDTDGKGESIWDAFTAKKGKVLNGHRADVACNFYNNYREDIDLVKKLNIPNFRFSISWTRVLSTPLRRYFYPERRQHVLKDCRLFREDFLEILFIDVIQKAKAAG